MYTFLEKLDFFSGKEASLLKKGLHGLEKECLRVTSKKLLALTKHPSFLGAPFTHPHFSTDFGEAQLELVTDPYHTLEEAYLHLEDLHLYIHHHLDQEWLWPMSSPCSLPDFKNIELAKFGYTKEAYEKWLYRKGLSFRYGKSMQLLSGIHYSFSFTNSFWKNYHQKLQSKQNLSDFISDCYLHMTRNFLRVGWICSYLFGASPIVDKSYFKEPTKRLKAYCKHSYHAPYGTSIRMSDLGYFSQIQCQNAVSFNKLNEYMRDLKYMLETPNEDFQKIGIYRNQKRIQLNENILQTEAEHYTRIRPKPKHIHGARPLKALEKGIAYVESRILDLNPFCENGLDLDTLYFMHLLFVYCLLMESPPIQKGERQIIFDNQNKVALKGRTPGLQLTHAFDKKQVAIKNWSLEILEDLKHIAALFDRDQPTKNYQKALGLQENKVRYPYLTPSAQILDALIEKKQSFIDFSFLKSKAHHQYFISKPLPKKLNRIYSQIVKKSQNELKRKEEQEDYQLAGYEDMELSSQVLLKEAMRQSIQFKILDRKSNLILLKKNEHVECVKQATLTRLDPLISYFLMENKQATKDLLKEKKLNVPFGKTYRTAQEALNEYATFKERKVVVKPNLANMGQGISFVEPCDIKSFNQALEKAAKYKQHILVEDFFSAEEYRFLIIQNKVVAVCQRIPAHIEGDGLKTVRELIRIKNKLNAKRARFQKPLKVIQGDKEKILNQIPEKGQKIFLMQNSNVSTGGDSVDFTDEMPLFYKKVALEAAKAVSASICGVDMMIQSLKKEPSSKLYRIIELNFNPALYLHRFPSVGKKRLVEKDVLKALGF